MSTDQKYEGKGEFANDSEGSVKPGDSTANLLTPTHNEGVIIQWPAQQTCAPPLKIKENAFIDGLGDIQYISDVRQAVRAWFCAWSPEEVRSELHGPRYEIALVFFQDLDEFIGDLITASAAHHQTVQEATAAENERLRAQVAELTAIAVQSGEIVAESRAIVKDTRHMLAVARENLKHYDPTAQITSPINRSDN